MGWVGWSFWSVGDPLPLFKIEIPPRGHRAPAEEALPLKERSEGENLRSPPIQFVRHQVIRCEGDDDRLLPVTGQLDIGIEHPRSGALGEVTQGSSHCPGIVKDIVTVDVCGGALETFAGAPFEELAFVN